LLSRLFSWQLTLFVQKILLSYPVAILRSKTCPPSTDANNVFIRLASKQGIPILAYPKHGIRSLPHRHIGGEQDSSMIEAAASEAQAGEHRLAGASKGRLLLNPRTAALDQDNQNDNKQHSGNNLNN